MRITLQREKLVKMAATQSNIIQAFFRARKMEANVTSGATIRRLLTMVGVVLAMTSWGAQLKSTRKGIAPASAKVIHIISYSKKIVFGEIYV